MNFKLVLFSFLGFSTYAQNISNNFSGYFKNTKKDNLYSSIHFNGDGHAIINDAYPAEYFVQDNLLYVFPDKSVFIFEVEKNKIKGISNWVEKQTFKETTVPTNEDYEVFFETYTIDPNLLQQYYSYNYNEKTDEISWIAFEKPDEYLSEMQKLCDNDLTSACGALFGMKYIEATGGFENLFENLSENQQISENKELEKIAQKMINLEDGRGYALLGSYFLTIGNKEKAKEILTIGSEKGNQQAILTLFELEVNESLNESEIEAN